MKVIVLQVKNAHTLDSVNASAATAVALKCIENVGGNLKGEPV